MKTSAKTTLILALILILGNTSGVKAQGFNFISFAGKVIGTTTGDIVFKGKNHNGKQWSFALNLSYDSKPITPAKKCLYGFAEVSNAFTVASLNQDACTAPGKMFISNHQAIAAISRINMVSPSIKEQLPAFYPNGDVIKTQPAPALIVLANL